MLPNFLIVGAARAGTTSLYHYLRQHPQIFLSVNKEPMHFALDGQKPEFAGPGDDREINLKSVPRKADYEALFDAVAGETAVGEASALYLYAENVPERIHRELPNARLVAILRNPVERAYSSFLYMVRDRREPLRDFAQALAAEPERIQGNWEHIWHYRTMGLYCEQLSRYFHTFSRDQIRVYLHEDLSANPGVLLRDLFLFLGVDPDFEPDIGIQYNAGGVPRHRHLNALLTHQSGLKRLLKPYTPAPLMRLYQRIKQRNLDRPPLDEAVRFELIESYREDILGLQDLLGRDLGAWLK